MGAKMIKQRSRVSTDPELNKAKKSGEKKVMFKMTAYIPREDAHKLKILALKKEDTLSELVARIVADYLSSK